MICVYASGCTDFSNNGLGPVNPQSCTVTETLNGEWELTLVHPIDDLGKWQRLAEGNILRAPVPAGMTPKVNLVSQSVGYDIYKITTKRDPLRLRSGTGTSYKILGKYKKGTEVIVIAKTSDSWYEVSCPDGRHGYMSAEYLTFVRSTGTPAQATGEVIEARQLRDQPFRIYRVVPELDKITVYARHIFYDLLDNMIKKIEPSSSTAGATVAQNISSKCLSEHDFTFYSDMTTTAEDVLIENVNPIEALLGEGGLTDKYGAELARDWFDVFLVKRVGSDTDVQIREGKNLTGISFDVDETDVTTRIMPTGEDEDGNILYLPELYIDSPNIGAYIHPKWIHLQVSEAREVKDGDDKKSKSQCYTDMRKAAQAEFDAGCDLPSVTLKVDFVNLTDAEEYKQYTALTNIFLGDSVRVVARRIGVEVSMRMTQYSYDCLTRKYTSVTLGTVADTLEGSAISARQLASGSITGAKLAINSVGAGQLQSGSVGSLQIKNAAIQTAHIQTAAIQSAHIQDAAITRAHIAEALIETLNVNALTAVTAKIQELAAGSITTDELYTSIAMIATAQLTTANIINANIEWAQIQSLAADIATISKAQITSANIDEANIDWAAITTLSAAVASMVKADIGTADIDWSHIKDLTTDTAIITQGTAGELYIAKLAVTEANMVSLTVGELVVKGEDGRFYAISVDADGNITSTVKQIANDDVADTSINGGEKIIEGSITAGTLNVQEIFGDNATIRNLIAANLDVDTLFARQATINALNAMDITSNTYLRLMVSGKADQSAVDALGQRMDAAELKITEDAIVSTVTGSQKYKDDLASVSVSGGGTEMIVGTQTATTAAWKGNASFTELKDGQQIAYWLPYTSGSNVTLELTLSDGSSTGAIPCYYSQSSRLSTQYPSGNIIRMTYRKNAKYLSYTIAEGWWVDANYNTDTYDRIRAGGVKAKEALTAFRLVVGDADGYFVLSAGKAFTLSKPILWNTGTCTAGNVCTTVYAAYTNISARYMISDFTGVTGSSIYLVGILEGDTFLPSTTLLTSTPPTEEDGLTYILLGVLSSTYSFGLFPEHPVYRFVDGEFRPLSQVAYEAYLEVGEVRTEMQTAIEQTNAAIALKANQTTVDSLSERVESAELKLEPDQLIATVRSSDQYRYDRFNGRNYVLDSTGLFSFEGGYYKYPSGTVSAYTGLQLNVSDDLFAHSGEGKTFRLSFDIKRSSVEAASASTAGVYCGIWIYYKYYNSSGGISVTGRGYYLRTSDTDFASTDSDWVHVKKGPLSLTAYNPIGIAYVLLGTSNAVGSTGSLQFRNVKCEVGDSFTDWSAAPEDLNDLPDRMTTAESNIQQNANNIALKVSTSTYNTEKVYRGSTAPTTKYTNMLWLDTSVTPNLLKRYTGSTWVVAGAEEVKSSGVYIGPNQVSITTENFLLQLLDPADNENVLMEMSANGNVGFKDLYADNVISDSVAPSYDGSAWLWVEPSIASPTETDFRSLGEAVQSLNNKFLKKDVVIYLPYGYETYEPSGVLIQGISGPGKLTIYGYGSNSILNSYIKVKGCFAQVCFQNMYLRESRSLNGSSRQPYLVELLMNHYVEFNGCTLDANSITYDSVYNRGSYVYLTGCGLYNALQGLEVFTGQACMMNCVGSCNWSMVSYAGIIIASGTVPAGSRGSGNNGQVFANSVTVDYGTLPYSGYNYDSASSNVFPVFANHYWNSSTESMELIQARILSEEFIDPKTGTYGLKVDLVRWKITGEKATV